MLKRLRIQNFILIDQLDLPILSGMTAMTGAVSYTHLTLPTKA